MKLICSQRAYAGCSKEEEGLERCVGEEHWSGKKGGTNSFIKMLKCLTIFTLNINKIYNPRPQRYLSRPGPSGPPGKMGVLEFNKN